MPATLTVHDHRRESDGTFRLVVLVQPADVATFSGVAADAEQKGEDVIVTTAWAADAPVEDQLVETRRLIEAALSSSFDDTMLVEPGVEL